jgi:hypothetical protein
MGAFHPFKCLFNVGVAPNFRVNLEEYGYVKDDGASLLAQPLVQSVAQPLLQAANTNMTSTTVAPPLATNSTDTYLLSECLQNEISNY